MHRGLGSAFPKLGLVGGTFDRSIDRSKGEVLHAASTLHRRVIMRASVVLVFYGVTLLKLLRSCWKRVCVGGGGGVCFALCEIKQKYAKVRLSDMQYFDLCYYTVFVFFLGRREGGKAGAAWDAPDPAWTFFVFLHLATSRHLSRRDYAYPDASLS